MCEFVTTNLFLIVDARTGDIQLLAEFDVRINLAPSPIVPIEGKA